MCGRCPHLPLIHAQDIFKPLNMKKDRIGIIGAGPAGIAASIQLKRYGLTPVVFERNEIGGFLANANLVENYPGFPEGISGDDLVERMRRHLTKFEVDIRYEAVMKLDYVRGQFELLTEEQEYSFDYIVVASGTSHREFDDSIVNSSYDGKVVYEITSIKNVASKTIAVIGAGDAAFDYALNLASQNSVMIFNRGDKIKCLPVLYDRVMNNPGISYLDNTRLIAIREADDNKLTIDITHENKTTQYDIDYLVIAIGREPNLDFLADGLLHNLETLITSGLVHFAGDVSNDRHRQVAIAAGDGVKAAMKIYERIKEVK